MHLYEKNLRDRILAKRISSLEASRFLQSSLKTALCEGEGALTAFDIRAVFSAYRESVAYLILLEVYNAHFSDASLQEEERVFRSHFFRERDGLVELLLAKDMTQFFYTQKHRTIFMMARRLEI